MDFRPHVRSRLPSLTIARAPEVVDELAEHLGELYQEARASGASHEAAFARAVAALPDTPGQLAQAIETASRALPGLIADRWRAGAVEPPSQKGPARMFATLSQDLRYALRMLAGAPAFTAVVVLTLALGVGANAVIFTAVDAILLRTPGVADPDSVVHVFNASTTDGRERFATVSFPDYADVRDSQVFAGIAAAGFISLAIDLNGETQPLEGEVVTGNYFQVLGTRMARGRAFLPDEDRAGTQARAAVVSYRFWQNRLQADPGVLSRSILLNGQSFTIVGVAPRLFGGATIGRTPDVWVPMALQPEVRPPSAGLRRSLGTSDLLGQRGPRWLSLVARLQTGTDQASAAAALDVVAKRLQAEYPATNRPRAFNIAPLGDGPGLRTSARPLLRLLGIAVILVLLIACANVASLLIARSLSRRREVAVRVALGAGSARLVRQWLTEAALLAGLGGLFAVLVAKWGAPLLHLAGIPPNIPLELNLRVLLFTLAAAACSSVLFGLVPVFQILGRDTIAALRDEGGAIATGSRAARLRRAFVVFQVAVSLVLLVGAGLFLRTLRNVHSVDLGYRIDSTMVADINLDVRGYSQEAGAGVYTRILERLRGMPGVAAAGAARITVLSGGARTTSLSTDGQPVAPDGSNAFDARVNVISVGYLDALGIPLLRGRDFSDADTTTSPRVAIISQSLANRLWPNQDPLNRPLGNSERPIVVVGVVPDTVYRSALEQEAPPFFYLPLAQNYESGVALHVRAAAGDPIALLPSIRTAVRDVDPRIVVARPQRLRDVFAQGLTDQRMMALLVAIFGAVALALASIGLYGVMAHAAGQRRAEIGLRLALGAQRASIFGLVLKDGLRLVLFGSVLGMIGAFAGAKYVASQLFGVRPVDPLTFALGCVLLTIVATLACLLPARRAMRVDPVVALRGM